MTAEDLTPRERVAHHATRLLAALEAITNPPGCGTCITGPIGDMLEDMAVNHARDAARAYLGGPNK